MFSDANLCACISRLCEKVLQSNQVENDDTREENFTDATAVIPPKNKEALHVHEVIGRRLQFEGENMDRFLRLEKKCKIACKIKLNKQQLRSISLETNRIQLNP